MSSKDSKPKILVIVGPTASGKSALAVELARRFSGEVISADSRQVYKGMDVGSGKITRKEMRGVPHHLLSVASPKGIFSAERYRTLGTKAMQTVLRRKKLPIICGGTGFYIDALLDDYGLPSVSPNPALRKQLENLSTETLVKKLESLDPARAEVIDRANRPRLIRSLEIVIDTGKPVPALKKTSLYAPLKIGINIPIEKLETNIEKRLHVRLAHGLVEEIKKLHKEGISWKRLDDFGLEYRYLSRFVRGLIAKEAMIESILKESRQYAKRQMTWWKRDKEIHWVRDPKEAMLLAKRFFK